MKAFTIILLLLGIGGTVGYLIKIRPDFDAHTIIKAEREETLAIRTQTEKDRKEEFEMLTKELAKQVQFVKTAEKGIATVEQEIAALNKKIREERAWRQEKIEELAEQAAQFDEDHDELMEQLLDEFGPFRTASVPGQLQRKQSEESSLEEERNGLLADIDAENDVLQTTIGKADEIREFFRIRRASLSKNNFEGQIIEHDKE